MKGVANDMDEIIVYHDPLEARFWTHMEISIPIIVILTTVIIYSEWKTWNGRG